MGLFSKLRKKLRRAVKTAIRDVRNNIKQSGKHFVMNIKKDVRIIERDVRKVSKATEAGFKFVIKHTDDIAKVGKIAGEVMITIGTLTAQPELVAMGAGIREGSILLKRAHDTAESAQKFPSKVKKHVKNMKRKSELVGLLTEGAGLLRDIAELSGDKDLIDTAKNIQRGADIADASIKHGETIANSIADVKTHVDKRDIRGGIVSARRGVRAGTALQKTVDNAKKLRADLKAGIKPHFTEGSEAGKLVIGTGRRQPPRAHPDPESLALPPGLIKESLSPPKKKRGKKQPLSIPEKKRGKKEPLRIPQLEGLETPSEFMLAEGKKQKPVRKKRKPSPYNIFFGIHRKRGLSVKEVGALWQEQKKGGGISLGERIN